MLSGSWPHWTGARGKIKDDNRDLDAMSIQGLFKSMEWMRSVRERM